MRKLSLILLAFTIIIGACKKDETTTEDGPFLAPTTQMKKNVVLEDFTGVRCGYCPDGHVRAKALEDANPGKIVVICVHAGSYAAPASGWANFTTPFGDAISGQTGLTGYPAGTVNRHVFSGLSMTANKTAMGRGNWASAANQILAENASVNLGAKATFNSSTRVLTVKVDLYYTSDETAANNINVAFLQNGIPCNQSGGTPANAYLQNNVMRTLITGQWGEVVPASSTKATSKYTKTYTYTVPADYNGATIPPGGGAVDISKCDVAVYVTRGQQEVLNGIKVKVQ